MNHLLMIKTWFFIVFLSFVLYSEIQKTDAIRRTESLWATIRMPIEELQAQNIPPVKCGTFLMDYTKKNLSSFSIQTQQQYMALISAKTRMAQAGIITYESPSSQDRFVVYYTVSGSDAVPAKDILTLTASGFSVGADGIPDYVEYVAAACDSAYHYIVQTLGYTFTSPQIQVRMSNLGSNYGFAYSDRPEMEIDNDLAFLASSKVRDGYSVTIAHEFFHMVQFGYSSDVNFFNEPSAVWMEEEMYPDVDDYLQYVKDTLDEIVEANIFKHPDTALDYMNPNQPTNYDKVVWPMFLSERYSAVVIRNAWENYKAQMNGTTAVFDDALKRYDSGLSFTRAFGEFGQWLFYTNKRANAFSGFHDAQLWPLVQVNTLTDESFIKSETKTVGNLSFAYQVLDVPKGLEIGYMTGWNMDSLGVQHSVVTQTDALIWDTLLFPGTANYYFSAQGMQGREFFNLFNSSGSTLSLKYALFDSVLMLYAGDTLKQQARTGAEALLITQDTIRTVLRDSSGRADSLGSARLTLFSCAGVPLMKSGSLPYTLLVDLCKTGSVFNVVRAEVDTAIEPLLDSGWFKLQFVFEDSSARYQNYSVLAIDSLARTVQPLMRKSSGFTLDYSAQRLGFSQMYRGRRVLFFCSKGAVMPVVGLAFPNPVLPQTPVVRIAFESGDPTASCLIYTLAGSLVRSLSISDDEFFTGPALPGGFEKQQVFLWDLKNEAGHRVRPGLYLFQLSPGQNILPVRGKLAVLGHSK